MTITKTTLTLNFSLVRNLGRSKIWGWSRLKLGDGRKAKRHDRARRLSCLYVISIWNPFWTLLPTWSLLRGHIPMQNLPSLLHNLHCSLVRRGLRAERVSEGSFRTASRTVFAVHPRRRWVLVQKMRFSNALDGYVFRSAISKEIASREVKTSLPLNVLSFLTSSGNGRLNWEPLPTEICVASNVSLAVMHKNQRQNQSLFKTTWPRWKRSFRLRNASSASQTFKTYQFCAKTFQITSCKFEQLSRCHSQKKHCSAFYISWISSHAWQVLMHCFVVLIDLHFNGFRNSQPHSSLVSDMHHSQAINVPKYLRIFLSSAVPDWLLSSLRKDQCLLPMTFSMNVQ